MVMWNWVETTSIVRQWRVITGKCAGFCFALIMLELSRGTRTRALDKISRRSNAHGGEAVERDLGQMTSIYNEALTTSTAIYNAGQRR